MQTNYDGLIPRGIKLIPTKQIRGTSKLVYSVLFDAIGLSGEAMLSNTIIASRCGITPNTVSRAIKQLSKLGLIFVDYEGDNHNLRMIRLNAKLYKRLESIYDEWERQNSIDEGCDDGTRE